MNEASVNLLKQNNGMKEIFSNNFFLSTFQSYHPLRENAPYLFSVAHGNRYLPRSSKENVLSITITGNISVTRQVTNHFLILS